MGSIPPFSSYNPYSYDPHGLYNPAPNAGSSASRASSSSRPPHQRRFIDSAMDSEPPHLNSTSSAPLPPRSFDDGNFDILEWHPAYQSCQRYFLDHAQFEPGTQALCALINIRLPFQWLNSPVNGSSRDHSQQQQGLSFNFNAFSRASSSYNSPGRNGNDRNTTAFVSPLPYIRRLIVTGFDKPAILHGFFGDEWQKGIMPHVECERRNYLFAAKHGGWRTCKKQYDVGSGGGGDESVPFMKPLEDSKQEELTAAEKAWSQWLAMEDWMVGPRAPEEDDPAPTGGARTGHRGGGASLRDSGMPDGV
ncbi:Hypothetical predicted protein [Lecanosticta acicola]|uniref:Ilp is an apoptosis inhibitor n=1 Tax=Lecanosticta acicola TaxID=111012 RepID=A0AAI8YYK8_9PEZI|nr:Hypothetical predicted protein [Lecanosticta acicola]